MAVLLQRTTSDDPRFLQLHARLSALLSELNGEADSFYAAHNRPETLRLAVLAIDEQSGAAVGCGGLRPHDSGAVEIKRMYVEPAHRGQGVARAVLDELLRMGAAEGFPRAVLETSRRLEAAVRLYRRAGFEVIPNFPPYVGLDDSVCMERVIGAD